ncbi:MAG: helix-hairpin-helix domain-containing protein [Chloroflexota bacterium]|nr:helix-hairpin-helix domain-containing protein [Chloroflexota bacterium]MDE2856656.1 helix-hairpin-helix domain-containing protein [Chloroflexota bacterium]
MSSLSSSKITIVVYLLAIIFMAFGGTMLYLSRPEPTTITINPPLPTATNAPTATPGPILVYVTGAVILPESTHELPFGSRVQDAIAAAGGFANSANKTLVNVAGILRDGDQIHVPSVDEQSLGLSLPTPSGGDLLRINTASENELLSLPGVGPALAGRIAAYRDEIGSIDSFAELDKISGIGEATIAKWQDLIAFD